MHRLIGRHHQRRRGFYGHARGRKECVPEYHSYLDTHQPEYDRIVVLPVDELFHVDQKVDQQREVSSKSTAPTPCMSR